MRKYSCIFLEIFLLRDVDYNLPFGRGLLIKTLTELRILFCEARGFEGFTNNRGS